MSCDDHDAPHLIMVCTLIQECALLTPSTITSADSSLPPPGPFTFVMGAMISLDTQLTTGDHSANTDTPRAGNII